MQIIDRILFARGRMRVRARDSTQRAQKRVNLISCRLQLGVESRSKRKLTTTITIESEAITSITAT